VGGGGRRCERGEWHAAGPTRKVFRLAAGGGERGVGSRCRRTRREGERGRVGVGGGGEGGGGATEPPVVGSDYVKRDCMHSSDQHRINTPAEARGGRGGWAECGPGRRRSAGRGVGVVGGGAGLKSSTGEGG